MFKLIATNLDPRMEPHSEIEVLEGESTFDAIERHYNMCALHGSPKQYCWGRGLRIECIVAWRQVLRHLPAHLQAQALDVALELLRTLDYATTFINARQALGRILTQKLKALGIDGEDMADAV